MNELISDFYIVNFIISLFLFFIYILFANFSLKTYFFFILGCISTNIMFYYVIGIPVIIFHMVGFVKISLLFLGLSSIFLNIALIVNFFIFRIFKFHINGMVMNIILSPAAWNNVHIGFIPVFSGVSIIGSLFFIEFYLYKYLTLNIIDLPNELNFLLIVSLIILILEKLINGFANMLNMVSVSSTVRTIPFYQRVSMRHIQRRFFKNLDNTRDINMKIKNTMLNYPVNELKLKEEFENKDIFIFVSDAVRNSFITEEITPNIYSFGEKNLRFNNHFSGGAATRYGLFSIFYGLNGIYWHSFLAEQKGALLFDVLKKRDYQNIIVSSSTLSWPEFRKTAFVEVTSDIKDDFSGEIWEKDKKTAEFFIDSIKNIPQDKNVFSFVFFDAPHGPYSYPKDFRKFQPDNDGKINYMNISEKHSEIYKNQYLNAVNFNDDLIGKMLDTLKKCGRYDNSVIIIMSDHGEEFFECGNYGHNNAYTNEQTNSFLTIKYNNKNEKINKMTSNVDIIPFLFDVLGVENNYDDYSNGKNILEVEREQVFLSKWSECAIKNKDNTFIFPFKAYEMGKLEVRRNSDYKILDKKIINDNFDMVIKEMENNSRFFK